MASGPSSPGGMLSREQLNQLFDRFAFLTSQPDVKKRIKEAVDDNQEAVAVTTAIQEEILTEMGINPRFGISCLGKVNGTFENDKDLMIQFYRFIAMEEMACDEAELEPEEFSRRILSHQKLQEQQLAMLKDMRRFPPHNQSIILQELRREMEGSKFEGAAVLSHEQIEQAVRSQST
ncbi:plant/protein [Wolffia australiana]